jgi:hypothetical protein
MATQTQTIKGYKIFNPDFTCRGYQFEENKEFITKERPKICNSGFHFCTKAQDCFRYYDFNPENIVCEVEALGKTDSNNEDSKVCTDHIKIGKRLTWQEVLVAANTGKDNTGHSNSGYRNSGDRNSGDRNSGDRNSGNSNSGDRNSGYRNSGDSNSGNSNSGDSNSGDRNSGNRNSGNRNSGDRNSGDSNSGDRNSGNWNSGDRNSGNRNSGNWNSGYRNSGDSNSGYRNSGAFCTADDPVLYLFNKPTDITVRQWENHPACELMYRIENTMWIPGYAMNDEEKKANPKWETTGGYLKTIPMKEAWQNFWHNLNDESKALFTSLPNFDINIFYEITGLKIS